MALSDDGHIHYFFFLRNFLKFRGCFNKKNNRQQIKYALAIDTVDVSMYIIDEMMITRLFL